MTLIARVLNQSLNTHSAAFQWVCMSWFGLKGFSVSPGSEGQMRSLGWAFATRTCEKYPNLISSCSISSFHKRIRKRIKIILYGLIHYMMYRKRYNLACAPTEDSDQPVHQRSLIRVFDASSMGCQGSNVSSGGRLRLWSDCVDTQTGLNLHYTHKPTCLWWTLARIIL